MQDTGDPLRILVSCWTCVCRFSLLNTSKSLELWPATYHLQVLVSEIRCNSELAMEVREMPSIKYSMPSQAKHIPWWLCNDRIFPSLTQHQAGKRSFASTMSLLRSLAHNQTLVSSFKRSNTIDNLRTIASSSIRPSLSPSISKPRGQLSQCSRSTLNLRGSQRNYASKSKPKTKSTENFVPGSQQKIQDEEAQREYAKAEGTMKTAVEWFKKECAGFETRASGRVTPAILSPVRVSLPDETKEYNLEELATVGVREGTTLLITLFEDKVRCLHQVTRLPLLTNDPIELEARRICIAYLWYSRCCAPQTRCEDDQGRNTQVLYPVLNLGRTWLSNARTL